MVESGFRKGYGLGILFFPLFGALERAPVSSEREDLLWGPPDGEREALIRPRHRKVAHRTACESQLITGPIY